MQWAAIQGVRTRRDMTSALLAPHAMKRVQAVISWAQRNGLFFALVILSIYFSTVSHHFLAASSISVVLLQVSVVGIMAIPGAMLVLSGYVDLSVGSVSGLTAVVFAWLFQVHTPELLALFLALAAGTGWGVMNGYLISYLGFSPIIVTLGGLAGARGLAEVITQGYTVFGFGRQFAFLGVLANGLVQINISPFFSQFAVGIALVFAAALDVLYQRLDRVQLAEEAEAAPPTELEEDLLQDTLLSSQGGGTHEVV